MQPLISVRFMCVLAIGAWCAVAGVDAGQSLGPAVGLEDLIASQSTLQVGDKLFSYLTFSQTIPEPTTAGLVWVASGCGLLTLRRKSTLPSRHKPAAVGWQSCGTRGIAAPASVFKGSGDVPNVSNLG